MPAIDRFANNSEGLTGPADDAEVITPDASAELISVTRAVWVGGAGTLAVVMANGQAVTFSGIAAGTLLPIRVRAVRVTGTTATLILGLY